MRSRLMLVLLTVASLSPFLAKPLHIDDPVYVRAAQHIAQHPLDPYGFAIQWLPVSAQPVEWDRNPPGVSYYLAAAGSLLGWTEVALHGAMLLPAALLVVATAALGRRLRASPALAGALVLAMPAVLVSATTLMADTLATALWCGAVLAWLDGLERRDSRWLAGSAVLASACILTKYLGLALVPLLVAYTIVRERRADPRIAWLAIPVIAALAFGAATRARYGVDPLYAIWAGTTGDLAGPAAGQIARIGIGMAFFIGAFLPVVAAAPSLRRVRRRHAAQANCDARNERQRSPHLRRTARTRRTPRSRRSFSPTAALLALWTGGIFAFAVFANWTVNVRALLPAAPALAISAALALECRPRIAAVAIVTGLALGLVVAQGDMAIAQSARAAAWDLAELHGAPVWFQGAWGFQWYAERAGAQKIDMSRLKIRKGDWIVTPDPSVNGGAMVAMSPELVTGVEVRHYAVRALVSTVSRRLGAGWYSSVTGPLPYAPGAEPADYTFARAALDYTNAMRR